MKILIVTGLFYPSKLGGPANTLYWLAKALVKAGVDVTVVATYRHIEDGKVYRDEWNIVDGIRVMYCSAKGKLPLNQVRCAAKELKAADIIMLSSVCYLPNTLVALLANLKHKKIIWSPRGELIGSALSGNRLKLIHFTFLKHLLGRNVCFHATSGEERDSIQKVFGQKFPVEILPNYMDVPAIQKRNNIEPPYLLYVGRIAPIKALDNLLEGLARSKRFMESCCILKIVGGVENQFKPFYEKLLAMREELCLTEKVDFVGSKSGDDKYQIYADAKFSMLVSKSENFGNVVIEALSQGTPVIASYGTPWQILEDRKAGFWIDNSPKFIAACLDKALSMDDTEYSTMRGNAMKLVEEFDISKNVQKWVDVIKEIQNNQVYTI